MPHSPHSPFYPWGLGGTSASSYWERTAELGELIQAPTLSPVAFVQRQRTHSLGPARTVSKQSQSLVSILRHWAEFRPSISPRHPPPHYCEGATFWESSEPVLLTLSPMSS